MRIGQLQYVAGIASRDTLNTWIRRGHLPFLDRDLVNGRGIDRFSAAHALGLAAVRFLTDVGLYPAIAGNAVNASWHDIKSLSQGDPEGAKYPHCGVKFTAAGIDYIGWPHPSDDGTSTVASSSVDIVTLWQLLQPALQEVNSVGEAGAVAAADVAVS